MEASKQEKSKKEMDYDRMRDINSFRNNVCDRMLAYKYPEKKEEKSIGKLFQTLQDLEKEYETDFLSEDSRLYHKYPRSHIAIQNTMMSAKSCYFEHMLEIQKRIIEKLMMIAKADSNQSS